MTLKPASLQWSDEGRLLNLDYDDVYFHVTHGADESYYVFLEGNDLPTRFKDFTSPTFHMAELGFGSGLNFLLTADLFLKESHVDKRLTVVSFEKHPILKSDLMKIYAKSDLNETLIQDLLDQYPPMIKGFHTLSFAGGRIQLMLCFGDVIDLLPEVTGSFDAWFLDGFAPVKNPDMWADSLYPIIAEKTKQGGTLATFTAVTKIRQDLERAGFIVEKKKGFGKKREMMTAVLAGSDKSQTPEIKPTVTVLGGGIAGCSAAYALARRGFDVTLIERRQNVAQETSGNPIAVVYPKIMLSTSPLAQFHHHGFCYTKQLIQNMGLKTWQETGVLHLNTDKATTEKHHDFLRKESFPENYIKGTDDGIFQPMAGTLSPVEFCQKLITTHNVRKIFAAEITRAEYKNNKWMGYTADGERRFKSDILIIAEGLNATRHAETSWVPLRPLRGQMTSLSATPQSKTLKHTVCHDGYITPDIHGRHYIGATFQNETPPDNMHDPETRGIDDLENLENVQKHFPDFKFTADNILDARAGYRAATTDNLPIAGKCPRYDDFLNVYDYVRDGKHPPENIETPYHKNLYITTGFGSHGMTGAPIIGEMIAAMIAGDPLPMPTSLIEFIVPERFLLRGLKRKEI